MTEIRYDARFEVTREEYGDGIVYKLVVPDLWRIQSPDPERELADLVARAFQTAIKKHHGKKPTEFGGVEIEDAVIVNDQPVLPAHQGPGQ